MDYHAFSNQNESSLNQGGWKHAGTFFKVLEFCLDAPDVKILICMGIMQNEIKHVTGWLYVEGSL